LLGVRCRYDGRAKTHPVATPELERLLRLGLVVPVCPEQLGGLPTPRPPARIVGGDGQDVVLGRARVVSEDGRDVTSQFVRGAEEALAVARAAGCREAVLKSDSPSCGAGRDRPEAPGEGAILGVTAAVLREHGIRVLDEHAIGDSLCGGWRKRGGGPAGDPR
jgi:uncharacterized protein YbbK (DUF523 family)